MTAPTGFIELTAEDGLSILAAVSEIAMVREAGPTVDRAQAIILFRSGEYLPVVTDFSAIVERLSAATEKDNL